MINILLPQWPEISLLPFSAKCWPSPTHSLSYPQKQVFFPYLSLDFCISLRRASCLSFEALFSLGFSWYDFAFLQEQHRCLQGARLLLSTLSLPFYCMFLRCDFPCFHIPQSFCLLVCLFYFVLSFSLLYTNVIDN